MNSLTTLSLLILSMVGLCSCETFHIVPVTSTEECDEEPCLTLDQFARGVVDLNLTSLTLYFLTGDHILKQKLSHISNVKYVNITGSSANTVLWLQVTEMSISNTNTLLIENITLASSNNHTTTILINSCGKLLLMKCTFKSIAFRIVTDCKTTTDLLSSSRNVSIQPTLYSSDLSVIACEFNQSSVDVSTLDYKVGFKVQINSTDFFQGGAIKIKGQYRCQIYLTNCEFRGNYYGAIEISGSARIIITNSTFIGNQYIESEFGTAVCDLQSKYLEVVDSNFIGNLNCDTVARVSANQILIATSLFVSNNCSQTLSIDDAFLTNIKVDTDSVLINDCSFVNNHGSSGGGIVNYIYGQLLIFITNCEFTANHADLYGGAIYSTNEIIISNSSFTENTARLGGAIYTDGKFVIVNCTYTNNFIKTPTKTKINGAAILAVLLNQQEQLSIKSVSIRNTVFTKNFGCETVAIVGSKVQMDNVSFINNGMKHDNRNRGCLYLFNIRLDVTGSMTVSGNVGGGIYAIQSHIYINSTKKTVITNNTAHSGGGVMLRDSELTIQAPVTISDNKVQLFGGGIYAYLSLVDFKSDYKSEGLISNNFAGKNGGGMFVVGSSIKLTRYFVIISSNTALLVVDCTCKTAQRYTYSRRLETGLLMVRMLVLNWPITLLNLVVEYL